MANENTISIIAGGTNFNLFKSARISKSLDALAGSFELVVANQDLVDFRALAEAALEHKGDLAAQKSALEKEKEKALSEKDKVFTKKLALQKKLLAEAAEDL